VVVSGAEYGAEVCAAGNLLAQVRLTNSPSGAAGADSVIEITQDGRVVWKYSDSARLLHRDTAGVPGTGHVLVFDNGYVDGNTNPFRASTRPYSRVLEINPLDQSIAWAYTAENSNRPIWTFFSHISVAQRQPNGNTLICEGSNGRIFEVTSAGEIVWENVNPFPNRTRKIPNATIFRAAKVPETWLKR